MGILPQASARHNKKRVENIKSSFNKSAGSDTPFIRGGHLTGIALEFFVRQMASRLISRPAADFLSKICNVAAASDAYQLYYSKATMAERAGVSPKSVQRYMRMIEASGILTRTVVTDSIRGHQPNVYTFSPVFLAAARSLFSEIIPPTRLKNIRTIAQVELSHFIDKALSPFSRTLRKALNLATTRAFFKALPIGQDDSTPTGQIDPQKEVEQPIAENKNLTPQVKSWFETIRRKAITGAERKAMTTDALQQTHKRREAEAGEQLRAAHARKAQSAFLTKRDQIESVATAPRNQPNSFNHARMEEENKKHDEVLAQAKANAQRDPEVIKQHLAKMRAMIGRGKTDN